MKLDKLLKSVLFSSILVVPMSSTVLADTNLEEIDKIKSEIEKSSKELETGIKEHSDNIEEQAELSQLVKETREAIQKKEVKIKKDKEKQEKLQKEFDRQFKVVSEIKEEIKKDAQATQSGENIVSKSFDYILDSQSLSDALLRAKDVTAYKIRQAKRVENFEKQTAELERIKAELDEANEVVNVINKEFKEKSTEKEKAETELKEVEKKTKEKIDSMKEEVAFLSLSLEQEEERANVLLEKAIQMEDEKEIKKQTLALTDYRELKKDLSGYKEETQVDISNALKKHREEMEKKAKEENKKLIPGLSDKDLSKIDLVIKAAQGQLGVPYEWGGTTPNKGLDCSGLMLHIYNQVGIELPRVSQDQQNVGKEIHPKDIRPGDMIFWGEPAHHVGVYVGNGTYIHAPQPGQPVQYSKYDLAGVSHIRRVIF